MEYVLPQSQQFSRRLLPIQHRDAIAVFADDVGILIKVSLKVARRIIAARSDDGIEALQALANLEVSLGSLVELAEQLQQVGQQVGVFVGKLDARLVPGGKNAEQVVKAHQRDIPRHDQPDAFGRGRRLGQRIALKPGIQLVGAEELPGDST